MFWLKKCPRCSGDLYDEKDTFGPYFSCVQCGFHKDIPEQIQDMVPLGLFHLPAITDGAQFSKVEAGGV